MFRFLLSIICIALVASCAHNEAPEPEPTQLEIREFQTRTFEVNDHSGVMKSILDVLQDDGYMVKNVSADLGFLSAVKEVGFNQPYWASRPPRPDKDITLASNMDVGFGFSTGGGMGVGMSQRMGRERRFATHQSIEATVNVTKFGQKVRVRASFQSKVYDNYDSVMNVKQIVDEEFYQSFFAKVDKGLFIQSQSI